MTAYDTSTSVTAGEQAGLPTDKQPTDTPASPKTKSSPKVPYTSADHIVHSLPAGERDARDDGQLATQTHKILNLAGAWGQLEVAASSLGRAYEILKDFEREDLPARTLNHRMRKLRGITKGIRLLVDEKDTKE